MTTKVFITYAHKDGPASNRFRQYIDDPLPPWAVDVREEAATPTPRMNEALCATSDDGHDIGPQHKRLVDCARQLERDLAAASEELAQAYLFIAETGDKLPDPLYIETVEREGLAEDCKHFATRKVCAKYLDVKWQTDRAIRAEEALAQERERAEANAKDAERYRKYLEIYDTEELTAAEWNGSNAITDHIDAAIAEGKKNG